MNSLLPEQNTLRVKPYNTGNTLPEKVSGDGHSQSCAPCAASELQTAHEAEYTMYTGGSQTQASMKKINVNTLRNVPATLLIPLYFKAKETMEDGILLDDSAVDAVKKIDYDFRRFDSDKLSQTGVAVRTMLLDLILDEMRAKHDDLIVVNLGAGLDTRPEKNADIPWFNVDFREVIELRKKIFPQSKATDIAKSVLDFSWIEELTAGSSVLFIAEGILMYLEEVEVRALFNKLAAEFPGASIAFDTIPEFMVGRSHKSVDTQTAPFRWGNTTSRKLEKWNPRLTVQKDYFFADYFKSRWSWMRLLYLIPFIRKGFKISVIKIKALNPDQS